MPIVSRPCGAKIHYTVCGVGANVLLLAPGGMRSCIATWHNQPYNPIDKLPRNKFRVIAMDQRCGAGRSDGPLPSGWETYRDDQLAVLDDAGVQDGCLLVGSCIGPSFIFSLLMHSPSRFRAAVLMQPIGIAKHTTEPGQPWSGLNTGATAHWYGDWAAGMRQNGRAFTPELTALSDAMFKQKPFVFTASTEEVGCIEHPLLVMAGKDVFHPTAIAKEIAQLAANAQYVEKWRDEHYGPDVDARIESFLIEAS